MRHSRASLSLGLLWRRCNHLSYLHVIPGRPDGREGRGFQLRRFGLGRGLMRQHGAIVFAFASDIALSFG